MRQAAGRVSMPVAVSNALGCRRPDSSRMHTATATETNAHPTWSLQLLRRGCTAQLQPLVPCVRRLAGMLRRHSQPTLSAPATHSGRRCRTPRAQNHSPAAPWPKAAPGRLQAGMTSMGAGTGGNSELGGWPGDTGATCRRQQAGLGAPSGSRDAAIATLADPVAAPKSGFDLRVCRIEDKCCEIGSRQPGRVAGTRVVSLDCHLAAACVGEMARTKRETGG